MDLMLSGTDVNLNETLATETEIVHDESPRSERAMSRHDLVCQEFNKWS